MMIEAFFSRLWDSHTIIKHEALRLQFCRRVQRMYGDYTKYAHALPPHALPLEKCTLGLWASVCFLDPLAMRLGTFFAGQYELAIFGPVASQTWSTLSYATQVFFRSATSSIEVCWGEFTLLNGYSPKWNESCCTEAIHRSNSLNYFLKVSFIGICKCILVRNTKYTHNDFY